MRFGWGAKFLHLQKFALLPDLLLNFVLLLTVVSYLFKVDWLCYLFDLLEKFLFLVGFFFFLLFVFFFKLDEFRLQIGPNSSNKFFVNLFELFLLLLPTLNRCLHPFLSLLAPHSRFHLLARLLKLCVDLLLSLCLFFNQLCLQLGVLESQTSQLVFLCHLLELILVFFDFEPQICRW